MTTAEIIELAKAHAGANSSALLALSDAQSLLDLGQLPAARRRALDSLKHSVGVFHDDFSRAVGFR
jgi:hypothetical protein